MKRFFFALVFSLFALPISAGTNARVARVIDSRTLLLSNGQTVTLRGVVVSADEEEAAAEYLRSLIGTASVFVEGGDVYRSPDALFVNGQMTQRAWQSPHPEHFLGMSLPGPHAAQAAPRTPAPQQRTAPPRPHRYPRIRLRK